MTDDEKKTYDYYRKKVSDISGKENSKIAGYIMLLPDLFYLLCKLMADNEVSIKSKAILAGAIAYLVSPVNIIPDFIPVVGLLDDIAVCAFALNKILNETDEHIIIRHWKGERNIIEIIQSIISLADDMLASGLVKKIKKIFE